MFVCHGNICRSPMAEFIFRDLAEKQGCSSQYFAASSGTSREEIWDGIGNPVYPPAREELYRHGIDCGSKRAVQLKKTDYVQYDLFLCMDSSNRHNALRIFGGDPENKVQMLLDYVHGGEVADPWYFGGFERTYEELEQGCKAVLNQLNRDGVKNEL